MRALLLAVAVSLTFGVASAGAAIENDWRGDRFRNVVTEFECVQFVYDDGTYAESCATLFHCPNARAYRLAIGCTIRAPWERGRRLAGR